MSDKILVHGTCISIGNAGVLIRGASGSGKTQTALTLLRRARGTDVDCLFVSDDQTLLMMSGDRATLYGHCPDQIRGRYEVFGYGIVSDKSVFRDSVELALVADLVEEAAVERMRPQTPIMLHGVPLHQLLLPTGNPELNASAIAAALGCTALI